MAVTATATLVAIITPDLPRPTPNMGWNNSVGDPNWIADIDWYRRVQLAVAGSAGEDIRTVNWECYDDTLLMKTTTNLTGVGDAAYIGTNPTLYGAAVNNTTTWTVWVSNGSVAANTVKYRDSGSPMVSRYRANGQRVQVLLGDRKKVGAASTPWLIAAFLPGSGRIPTATASITVAAPTSLAVGGYAVQGSF